MLGTHTLCLIDPMSALSVGEYASDRTEPKLWLEIEKHALFLFYFIIIFFYPFISFKNTPIQYPTGYDQD